MTSSSQDLAHRLASSTDQGETALWLAEAVGRDPVAALAAWSAARGEPFVYHPPTERPAGCPWQLGGSATEDLRTVLASWQPELKSFFKELEKRCVAVVPTEIAGRWHLTYVLQRGVVKNGKGKDLALWRWLGGPPSAATALPEAVRREFDDPIPAQLQAMYRVHDGFGPLGSAARPFDHHALLPVSELRTMDVEVPGFSARGLLVFMTSSVGDRYCALDQRRTRVVVWDRATGAGSYDKDTFSVLNQTWLGKLRGDWWMM